ncbi:MAG: AAA family ATPase [Clostridiales bacterium]|jgi:exonuclease SbcC|nr:AAA family ATPase [Clostridiales bacterium]
MKPLMLKIEGLNSFDSEQCIDFGRLCESGLFGICGPTGSGKSTIIDAITMALYDEMARYSSKNSRQCINASSSILKLYLSFEISGKVYIAERSYKRGKGAGDSSGGILAVSARLCEKDGQVLADKPSKVASEVEKLIGINYDDFTRSVILPQGKFSEFLLLMNKERCDMLGRIFRLEKYGDPLTRKFREKKSEVKGKIEASEYALTIYGDVSEEKIKSESLVLEANAALLENLKAERSAQTDEKLKLAAFLEVCDELLGAGAKMDALMREKPGFDLKKMKVELAAKADKVIPLIEGAKQSFRKASGILKKIEANLKDSVAEAAREEALLPLFEKASKDKDEIYPKLIQEEAKLNQAEKILSNAVLLERELEDISAKYKALRSGKTRCSDENARLRNDSESIAKELEDLDLRKREISVPQEFRQRIEEGCALVKSCSDFVVKTEKLRESVTKMSADSQEASSGLKACKALLSEVLSNLEAHSRNVPGSEEDVKRLAKEFQAQQKIFEEGSKILENLRKSKKKKEKAETDFKRCSAILDSVSKSRNEAEKSLADAELELNRLNKDNAVQLLAQSLGENEPCPVCGSVNHPLLAQHHGITQAKGLIESLERRRELFLENLEKEKKKHQDALVASAAAESRFAAIEAETAELLIDLGSFEPIRAKFELAELEKRSISMENAVKLFAKERKDLEESLNEVKLKEATASQKASYAAAALDERKQELAKAESEEALESAKLLDAASAEPNLDGSPFSESDFGEWKKKLQRFDRERTSIDKKERELKASKADIDRSLEKLQKELSDLESALSALEAQGQEKRQTAKHFRNEIESLTKRYDPKGELIEVKSAMAGILKAYDDTMAELEKVRQCRQTISKEAEGLRKEHETISAVLKEQSESRDSMLLELGFDSEKTALACCLDKAEQKRLEKDIADYEGKLKKAVDNVSRLEEKVAGRKHEGLKEKLKDLEAKISEGEIKIDSLTRANAVLQARLETMGSNLEKAQLERSNLKKLNCMHDSLADLEKLFQGNRFVEHIARRQLSYITTDASRRLKDMTSGRYALELSGTDFVVRDDYNGGIRRSPKTLSGGETFITSLCLALALSSKIQLKNRASLDLFFLDEGFGTLDGELLNTVMNTLERLKFEKMKVGVITHVEELKSRLASKLIVSPQEQGVHGTLVRMEN